jgi:putative transcriptional regulator
MLWHLATILQNDIAMSTVVRKNVWTQDAISRIVREMDAYQRGVGERLRELRKSRNLSQEDAAHAVGVKVSTWGHWERGETNPYPRNWQRIEATFGVDAAELRGTPPDDGMAASLDQLTREISVLAERLELLRSEVLAGQAVARDSETEVLRRIDALHEPALRPRERRRR